MKSYRWNKINSIGDLVCERCGKGILSGEVIWERTGYMSIDRFEAGKDNLPPAHFHLIHFLPPSGTIIKKKKQIKIRANH